MAVAQFMTGVARPYTAPVALATAILNGDLVALVANLIVNAAGFTWTTDLATTQTNFAAAFLGVAMQTKVANVARIYGNSEDLTIGVDVGGTNDWEYDCTAATYNVGDLVGPAKDTGNNLLSQRVEAVPTEARAIARVSRATAANATRVRIVPLSVKLPLARQS
jgi:hypothetical protein